MESGHQTSLEENMQESYFQLEHSTYRVSVLLILGHSVLQLGFQLTAFSLVLQHLQQNKFQPFNNAILLGVLICL